MPGGWPLGLELCNGQSVGTAGVSPVQGTTLTGPASNNTKTVTWNQLVASTTYDACYIMATLQYGVANGVSATCAFDIGIGSAGNEIAIMPNLMAQACGNISSGGECVPCYAAPISIPAGTRIAARYQSSAIASVFCAASVVLFDGALSQIEGYAGIDAVGFVAGTTLGTSINPGATPNTKPATYTTISASTARDYCGFMVGLDTQNVNTANTGWLLDIAVGASSSEQIIAPNLPFWYSSTSSTAVCPPWIPLLPIAIPAGTRISARCACQTASALLGVTIYGVYQ